MSIQHVPAFADEGILAPVDPIASAIELDTSTGAEGDAINPADSSRHQASATPSDIDQPQGSEELTSEDEITRPVTLSAVLRPLLTSKPITTLGGQTRYDTSALQALDGWESTDWAIVASGEGYADSICASGLAGALECPILLTGSSHLPDVTTDALT